MRNTLLRLCEITQAISRNTEPFESKSITTVDKCSGKQNKESISKIINTIISIVSERIFFRYKLLLPPALPIRSQAAKKYLNLLQPFERLHELIISNSALCLQRVYGFCMNLGIKNDYFLKQR
jgi:hypothetical protein